MSKGCYKINQNKYIYNAFHICKGDDENQRARVSNAIYVPRASIEPSPAKTKIRVETNSAKAALMVSG